MKRLFGKKSTVTMTAADANKFERRMNELFERERIFREEFSHGLMAEHRRFLEETFKRERLFREEFSHGLVKEMRTSNKQQSGNIAPMFYDHDGKIYMHNTDNQRLFLDARETYMALHVMEHGEWEPQVRAAMALILKPGDVYIDIGANIGLHTLYGAKLVGPKGRVIAVEAHPRTFSFLQENIEANGMGNYVALLCVAASDVAGIEADFQFFPQHPGMSGFKLLKEHIELFRATPEVTKVKTTTLDTLLAPTSYAADLVKIDVEGFELKVVEGGEQLFANNKDVCFLIEYQAGTVHAHLGPDAPKKFEGFFEKKGYVPFTVTHNDGLVKKDYADFNFWTAEDILFIHPKSRHFSKISK